MASFEAAARDWLSDPPWNKLFKNSFDVIEDQINRGQDSGSIVQQQYVDFLFQVSLLWLQYLWQWGSWLIFQLEIFFALLLVSTALTSATVPWLDPSMHRWQPTPRKTQDATSQCLSTRILGRWGQQTPAPGQNYFIDNYFADSWVHHVR